LPVAIKVKDWQQHYNEWKHIHFSSIEVCVEIPSCFCSFTAIALWLYGKADNHNLGTHFDDIQRKCVGSRLPDMCVDWQVHSVDDTAAGLESLLLKKQEIRDWRVWAWLKVCDSPFVS
jgi:hypothetical protein